MPHVGFFNIFQVHFPLSKTMQRKYFLKSNHFSNSLFFLFNTSKNQRVQFLDILVKDGGNPFENGKRLKESYNICMDNIKKKSKSFDLSLNLHVLYMEKKLCLDVSKYNDAIHSSWKSTNSCRTSSNKVYSSLMGSCQI